jgi:molybdate-binding protein
MARELEVSVEELFSLPDAVAEPGSVAADVLSSAKSIQGQPVRLARVGNRRVGIPVSARPYFLPEADAVVTGRGVVRAFSPDDLSRKQLVLAGCDPATNLLARMVERASGVELIPAAASSKLALAWLQQGKVHIAGSHLEDPSTGEFNLPYLKSEFPREQFAVVTFARWEEGLVVAKGNAKRIRTIADLARVTFMNRESGSGSRALLERLLKKAGIAGKSVAGYTRIAHGHLAAAYAIVSGEADCCLATRSAARTFDLDFLPLHSERYDLVMHKRTLEMPAARAFLDVLQRASLRRQLEALAGYDTANTGALIT